MNRLLKWAVPVAALAAVSLAPSAQAQGGFGQMPPEVQAKMKAWQKFMETHKNYNALRKAMAGLGACQKDPKTKLTKDQAKKTLAVLNAWEHKPTMNNEQAGQVTKQLTANLSMAQVKVIATVPDFGRGGRGFGGGARAGGGAGGGGGARPAGAGGGAPRFDLSKMPDPKEYNALNPDSLPETFRNRGKQSLMELKASLQASAK